MPSIYHGSVLRFIAESAIAVLKSPRRRFRQWIGRAETPESPEVARHFRRIEELVVRGESDAAIVYAMEVVEDASRREDAELLSMMSRPLERLEQYGLQARCLRESRRIRRPMAKDWDGAEVRGTLVVDYRYRNIALPLRHARLLALAAKCATHCIAFAEPRLVPLFQRSFPEVEIRVNGGQSDAAFQEADAVTTYLDLLSFFAADAESIAANFIPLRPDANLVTQFRARYRAVGDRPLVGISWGSSNQAKEAPAFHDWSPMFAATPATFVSLQYGNVAPALRKLRKAAGDRLVHDESVDQMVDMDRFAAQVASLDAVISTSNTIAHLAGALGTPSVVILNDNFYQFWPFFGARTPWNPRTVLVRKNGRDWPSVMREAQASLASILSGQKAN
jgi:hypothetical protein